MQSQTSFPVVAALMLALAFTASLPSCARPSSASSLSQAERTAIIDSACQALPKRNKADVEKGDEVPQRLWGEALAKLHPIRVLDDRINIFIVLKEDATTEEGLYVDNPISSYAAGTDERFVRFKKLTQPEDKDFGSLYECKILKEKPAGK